MMYNCRVNLTAQRLRRWVPSALRAPAAGYADRSAAEIARVEKVNGGHKLGSDLRATN